MNRRRAFTLTELLAVLVIVILLAATFVPYAMSLRESANRARCASNLLGIYQALSNYAARQNNHTSYPRTPFDASNARRWTAFTGADSIDPFAAGSAVQANDVTASMWLLVREELAKPSDFVCPSSDGVPDLLIDLNGRPVRGDRRGNFRNPVNLTYSIASPFSAVPDYEFVDTLPRNFVLLADQSPSEATFKTDDVPPFDASPTRVATINSVNHRRGGQNVLYASGIVVFEASPYCGVGRTLVNKDDPRSPERLDGDNIYTALSPTPIVTSNPTYHVPGVVGTNVGPAYRDDTYLVPGAGFVTTPIARPPSVVATPPASKPATVPISASAPTTVSTTQPK